MIIKYWKVGLIIFIAVLLAIITSKNREIKNLKEENKRQSENVVNLTEESFNLKLSQDELKNMLKNSESKFAKELDSTLKVNNIKIKDLNKIIQSKSKVTIPDTIELPPKIIYAVNDSIYASVHHLNIDCIDVSCRVVSKDKSPKLFIDKLETRSEGSFIVYKEHRPWWKFWKKRKILLKSTNKCGETVIKELEIVKK